MDSGTSATWDFNAPTFVDFSKQEHEKSDYADSYFDTIHETNQDNSGYSDSFLKNGKLDSDTFDEPNNNRCDVDKSGLSDDKEQTNNSAPCAQESEAGLSTPIPEDPDSLDEEQEPPTSKDSDVKQDSCVQMDINIAVTSGESELPVTDPQEMEVTAPPLEVTGPPLEVSAPPPEVVAPPSEVSAPPLEVSAPPLEVSAPPLQVAAPPSEVTAPPSMNEPSCKDEIKAVPSNIITPSRVASWNRAPRQINNNMPTPKTSSASRSDQLKKVKDLRRSARLTTTSATADTDGPPNKKKKNNKPKVKLVEPVTPTVLKHRRHTSVHKSLKSSEQIELEVIENLKHKVKQISKESSKSFKAAMNPSTSSEPRPPPKKTVPKEFKFKTDERVRQDQGMMTRSRTVSAEMSFIQGLRDHPPSPGKPKCTIVKPFKFASDRKRKLEMPKANKGYDFVPMANAVVNFTKKSIRSNKSGGNKGPMKAVPSLTVAKTPKLESRTRTRQVSVVSAEELEDREVQEMKSYQFKAKPVNRDILDHAAALPVVEKMKTTKPVEFHLEIDKRFEGEKIEEKTEQSPTKTFKARPIPKKIFEHVVGVPVVDPAQATIPQSPAFKLKNRMEVAQKNKENLKEMLKKEDNKKPLRKPTPKTTPTPVAPVPPKKVEVKPFSFEARDKDRFAKKEEKIKQIIEEEKAAASAFRATPILFSCPEESLPRKQKTEITKPKPFHFLSDERGVSRVKAVEEDIEEHSKVLREFRANTEYTKVLYGKGFKPATSGKFTEPEAFSLNTMKRATKREEFDCKIKHKEAEVRANQEKVRELKEKEDQEFILKARKEAEHKAAPIRQYKPVAIKASDRKLTKPQSPQFSDRFYKKV